MSKTDFSTWSDEELIQAVGVGRNKAALVAIFERYSEHLYKHVVFMTQRSGSITKRSEQAKTAIAVVQILFTKLWDHRENLIDEINEFRLRNSDPEGSERKKERQRFRNVRDYLFEFIAIRLNEVLTSLERASGENIENSRK